jgi:hypothetical protein
MHSSEVVQKLVFAVIGDVHSWQVSYLQIFSQIYHHGYIEQDYHHVLCLCNVCGECGDYAAYYIIGGITTL